MEQQINQKENSDQKVYLGFTITFIIFTFMHLGVDSVFYFFPASQFDWEVGRTILVGLIGLVASIVSYILTFISLFFRKLFLKKDARGYIELIAIVVNVILLVITIFHENSVINLDMSM